MNRQPQYGVPTIRNKLSGKGIEISPALKERLRLGVIGGVFLAVIYTALAAPALLGMLAGNVSPFSPGRVLLVYWVGSPLAGIVVGMLFPLTARWWGALLVGWLAAIPLAFGATVAAFGLHSWSSTNVFAFLFTSLTGPLVGLVIWRQSRSARSNQ